MKHSAHQRLDATTLDQQRSRISSSARRRSARPPRPRHGSFRGALLVLLVSILASCSLGGAKPTVTPVASPATAASPQPTFVLPGNLPAPTGSERKVDSKLIDLYALYKQQGRQPAEQRAREIGLLTDNNEVRLTLVLTDSNTKPVADKVQAMGGRIVATSDNLIDLVVPLDTVFSYAANNGNNFLQDLAAYDTVRELRVTPLLRPDGLDALEDTTAEQLQRQLAAVITEGVTVSGADKWHAAGITGKGIKIGIIDSGFSGYEALLGQELPSRVTFRSFNSANSVGKSIHGTACAEIVHAMAPDAELYLATYEGPASLPGALKWLTDDIGVKVISFSQGRGGEARGDGSGDWAKPVDAARAKGVLVVVASGNDGYAHYNGVFTDRDGNGWHEFAPGKEALRVAPGKEVDVVLRWDAWSGEPVNYDLYLFTESGALVGSSRNDQAGGKMPVEDLFGPNSARQTYLLRVKAVTTPVRSVALDIFAKNGRLELFTAKGSVATPGDAKGAFTIGAAVWKNDQLETFSSQGPTLDGRLKPELTGPDDVSTASYGKEGSTFPGTSAATPHVAGAAGLVYSALPGATPDNVQQFLQARAKDLEEPGPESKTGYGRLQLGDPKQLSTSPATGTPATPPPPRAASGPPFTDTFATPTTGLPNAGETRYDGGKYRIAPNGPNRAAWATYGGAYGDGSVELVLQFESGAPSAAGIVFWQTSNDDYYLFAVSTDGSYQIARIRGGLWSSLVPWTKNAAINATGPQTLRLDTRGATITFAVNGVALGTTQTQEPVNGRLGMLATSFAQPGAAAIFTTIKVTPTP